MLLVRTYVRHDLCYLRRRERFLSITVMNSSVDQGECFFVIHRQPEDPNDGQDATLICEDHV